MASDLNFWQSKRVCVTGGAGFLGSFVTAILRERGAANVFIPTIEKYDLVQAASIRQMLDDSKPDLIIHLAAQVGGIGIAPGANIGSDCALFEATHGTAPKYAGQDKVNPGSIILSAEMMLRHMEWFEAADLIVKGMEGAIAAKTVTYDFERLMEGAKLLKCSEFGEAIIENM